jgi:predicted ATPase
MSCWRTRERSLFRRLSVFAGGFDLAATEAVCSDEQLPAGEVLDGLTALVDKSLVAVETRSAFAGRYHLHETLRQYGQEKLAEASEDSAGSRASPRVLHQRGGAGVRKCRPCRANPLLAGSAGNGKR